MKNVKHQGLTLIEMMVTLSIMIILMMASINGMKFYYSAFAQARLDNLDKLITYSIIQARVNNLHVIVCQPTSTSYDENGVLTSNPQCLTTGENWGNNPIMAFTNHDSNGIFDSSKGDKIIANLQSGTSGSNLYWNQGGFLNIDSQGFLDNNGTFLYCNNDNEFEAALTINTVGRLRYITDTSELTSISPCIVKSQ